MEARIGDIECKAIYKGDVLLWTIPEGGEAIDGTIWLEDSIWQEDSIWNE